MPGQKNIAIVVDPRIAFGQAVMDGVSQFNVEHGRWRLATTSGLPYVPLPLVTSWQGDGVIGVDGAAIGPKLRQRGIPMVNIATYHPELPPASVVVDNETIGRLAARHLLDKGLRRFALVNWRQETRWEGRCRAFEQTVAQAGWPCERASLSDRIWQGEAAGFDAEELEAMLTETELPLGVFAVHDMVARGVAEACSEVSLRVPEDVAIIGEGNWRITCEMVHPKLTSVDSGAERIGYRAAQLLADLMEGKPAPEKPILIQPRGVVQRESSDVLAVDDELVRQALRFIRENHRRPIQVPDVAEAAAVNRRTLEKRFRATLGRTLHEEIRRVRVQSACEMLVRTDMTVQNIVTACGYATWERFADAFRRETGMNPSVYRQTHGR